MINVTVKNRITEASSVVRFVLGREQGGALPPFEAGAHISVQLPSGLLRQYSLCRLQSDPHYYEIAVLKDPQSRGGSVEFHQLTIGDSLRISEPKNHFPLVSKETKSLLIAGGIGITPLLPMAQTLQCTGASFEFHYCAKKPETAAFSNVLASCSFADKLHFHYSECPETSARMNIDKVLLPHIQDTQLYVCGPASFISSVLDRALELGWPEDRLHREYFSAPQDKSDETQDKPFQVKLASTGAVLGVSENQTIAQVLEKNGIFLPVSCEEGVCGACLTNVLAGEVDHRDVYLNKQEKQDGKQILPCCSRAKSDVLMLDL
ncbi:MAG: PDR/VanB family oxidoreductase [Reinekea sp.]